MYYPAQHRGGHGAQAGGRGGEASWVRCQRARHIGEGSEESAHASYAVGRRAGRVLSIGESLRQRRDAVCAARRAWPVLVRGVGQARRPDDLGVDLGALGVVRCLAVDLPGGLAGWVRGPVAECADVTVEARAIGGVSAAPHVAVLVEGYVVRQAGRAVVVP